jgi:hypothetical protein
MLRFRELVGFWRHCGPSLRHPGQHSATGLDVPQGKQARLLCLSAPTGLPSWPNFESECSLLKVTANASIAACHWQWQPGPSALPYYGHDSDTVFRVSRSLAGVSVILRTVVLPPSTALEHLALLRVFALLSSHF